MTDFDNNFEKALAAVRERKEARRAANTGPTVEAMIAEISGALPELFDKHFKVQVPPLRSSAGSDDGVYITFADVPRESSQLDRLNANRQIQISITPAPGYPWTAMGPSPEKLVAKSFTERNLKFRKKTGTWPQIRDSVVKFFKGIG